MWSLQFEAQSDAELKNFDNGLLPQLLDLYLLDFVAFVRTAYHFQFVYFIYTHLLIEKHWVHVVRVFVESWFFNSSTFQFGVDEGTTLATTFPREALLTNQRFLIHLDLCWIRLTIKASIILLRHFSPLCLALLNNVHSNLHPQVFLIVTKFVVHWLENGYAWRGHLLLQLLVGAQRLLHHAAYQVLLSLLDTVHTFCMIRGLERNLGCAHSDGWTGIVLQPRSHVGTHLLARWHARNILRGTRRCLLPLRD